MPRPLGHEPQRAAVFMHPLAGEWPLATMDIDAAPTVLSVPKPMDMEALRAQLHRLESPSSDKPAPTAEARASKSPDLKAVRKPTIQSIRKRQNDGSRITAARRDTPTDTLGTGARVPVTEKTRLVEQMDLTTRKFIEMKDREITELQAQV